MRRLVLFALAGLLLAVGVPDSPAASAPAAAGATHDGDAWQWRRFSGPGGGGRIVTERGRFVRGSRGNLPADSRWFSHGGGIEWHG